MDAPDDHARTRPDEPAPGVGHDVDHSVEPEAVTIYWRPGCGFCTSLAAGLRGAGIPFDPVNIWEDEDAAAYVRSVASGNEVVPTVRVGRTALVNPSTREVLHAAATEMPSLVARLSTGG